MSAIYKKPVNASISLRKETSTLKSLSNEQTSYTLCDRTDITSKYSHYFATFNIPNSNITTGGGFWSGDTSGKNFPELLQLNVDKIVVIPISENYYSEYIDGRSFTIEVPQIGNTKKTIISSFYSDKTKSTKIANSPINCFGPQNVSFLFSDDINKPYTGTTENGTMNHSLNTSWTPTNQFIDRPSAVAYKSQVKVNDYNSDERAWSAVSLATSIHQAYPNAENTSVNYGYNYDIPVGFVCLDKGFVVITHPQIVNNIPWGEGYVVHEEGYSDSTPGENVIDGPNTTSGTSKIVFTGTSLSSSASTMSFEDVSIRYLTSVTCIAMPKDFFISTNPTWPLQQNLNEIQNGTENFDSIYITQVGLYNAFDELIAVAKLDRPIEKEYSGILNFNLQIDI